MHMKRYSMPKDWPLSVKGKVWVGKPMPGPHTERKCITLSIVVRDVLKYTENMKETKKLLSEGKVLVDKKPKKEVNFPLGLMDIIEIPDIKDYFRMNINKNGLFLEKIKPENADKKLCRIENKTIIKKGKCQLNLHDGRNLLVDNAKIYNTGDSIVIQLPDQKIVKHIKLDKNATSMIIDGRNRGLSGKIKDIIERKTLQEKSRIILDIKGKEVETLKKYVMVIGDFI
ncbi:MAG: 30S ribosomal protein S4e [Nanoarchaeota archaeon]|nr:30S ribosomal protein S4e [Nanoarchaeota archaeon]MBU1135259.1 30S ribosomal protein S4e [Nanoarchaeota archaeon]MBU2519891.1 30S ribosomal protein S4e [Nanoarchaeota archaeon]